MEYLMIGLVLLCYFIYIIARIKDCGENPAYESWITEDKARYPELYD